MAERFFVVDVDVRSVQLRENRHALSCYYSWVTLSQLASREGDSGAPFRLALGEAAARLRMEAMKLIHAGGRLDAQELRGANEGEEEKAEGGDEGSRTRRFVQELKRHIRLQVGARRAAYGTIFEPAVLVTYGPVSFNFVHERTPPRKQGLVLPGERSLRTSYDEALEVACIIAHRIGRRAPELAIEWPECTPEADECFPRARPKAANI